MPSNETSRSIKSFVGSIELRDIRFDLLWAFGDVLGDVPKRIGSDEVLDSATNAFTPIIPFVHSGVSTEHMMRSYITGLRTMHCTLSGPKQACKGNVWAAIYLMWICQVSTTTSRFF